MPGRSDQTFVPVNLVGFQSSIIYFKFEENGKELYGGCGVYNSSIIYNGADLTKSKFKNPAINKELALRVFNFIDKTLPAKASVSKKAKNSAGKATLQDGTVITSCCTFDYIVIGENTQGLHPPPDFTDVPMKVVKDFFLAVNPEASQAAILKDDVFSLMRMNIIFIDGIPRVLSKDEFRTKMSEPDLKIYADISEEKVFDVSVFKIVLTYIGARPSQHFIDRYRKLSLDHTTSEVEHFFVDENGKADGGILFVEETRMIKLLRTATAEPCRVLFTRNEVYFHGISLDRADLKPFLLSKSPRLTLNLVEVTEGHDYERAYEILGADIKTYKIYQAEFVILGANLEKIVMMDESNKYEYDPNDAVLEKILSRHMISMYELTSHLDGSRDPFQIETETDESDDFDKATILQFVSPPQYESPTAKLILKMKTGEHEGKQAVVDRSAIWIHGCNLENVNLMEIFFTYKKNFLVECENSPSGFRILFAWIGIQPDPTSRVRPLLENMRGAERWCHMNGLKIDDFMSNLDGIYKRKVPYFPVEGHESMVQRHSSSIEGIYLEPEEGQFAVLQINQTPMDGTLCIIQSKDMFLMMTSLRKADLRALQFLPKDRIFVEIRKLEKDEEEHWNPIFRKALKGCYPTHIATLGYIGSRPKPPKSWTTYPNVKDIESNANLKTWLTKRHNNATAFREIILGQRKGSQPVNPPQPKHQPVNPPQQKRQPVNPPQQKVGSARTQNQRQKNQQQRPLPKLFPDAGAYSQFPSQKGGFAQDVPMLNSANNYNYSAMNTKSWGTNPRTAPERLTDRVMSCQSPEDPKVDNLIQSSEEYELGAFMAATLFTSLKAYNFYRNRGQDDRLNFLTSIAEPQASRSLPPQAPSSLAQRIGPRDPGFNGGMMQDQGFNGNHGYGRGGMQGGVKRGNEQLFSRREDGPAPKRYNQGYQFL